MSTERSSVRSTVVNAALIATAFGLLAWTVWGNRGQIREVLEAKPSGRLFVVGSVIYLVALVTTFARWYLLVRALGLPFRLRDALRLGFIGNVFNLVIPGAVGGDVIKAAYLCREQSRKAQAVASMVLDRILGLLGLFMLAGGTGAVAWNGAGADVRRLIVLVWAAVAAGFLALAVAFTPALYGPLLRLVRGRPRLERLLGELVAAAGAYRRRLGVVALALGMAVAGHALFVLAFYAVSLALYPTGAPSVAQHYLMVPLVLFTTAVPLPFGALGLTEGVSAQLFQLVAHPGGAVTMMGYRVLMYAGGLVSALVYVANLRQVRSLRAAGEPGGRGADLAAAGAEL